MFTKENAKAMQQKGVIARLGRSTSERRSLAAQHAALSRWYRPKGDVRERFRCHLRFLARTAAQLELEGDYNGAARAVMAMLPIEFELLELRAEGTKEGTPAPQPTETKSVEKIVTEFGTETPSPDRKTLLN